MPHYLYGLVYAHSIRYDAFNPVNLVTWSLEIEIQLFVLMPLLARVFAIGNHVLRRGVIVGTAALAVLAQSHVFAAHAPTLNLTLLGFLQYFGGGFLVADIFIAGSLLGEKPNLRWDAVWLASLGVIGFAARPGHSSWLLPIATFTLFLATFRGTFATRVFSTRWIYTIGGMCYSIYLIHLPVIQLATHVTRRWTDHVSFTLALVIQTILVVPVVLVVSALFFVLVERPCMNPEWPRRILELVTRKPQPAQAQEAT
jgi:peptidoglycan/LPS O-acetylase OafA/YrhL